MPPFQVCILLYLNTCVFLIIINFTILLQVEATNGQFTSNNYEVAYITFDEGGDIDDIVNVSMSRPTETSIHLEWHKIRAVEGYQVELRLPAQYAKRKPYVTQNNQINSKYIHKISMSCWFHTKSISTSCHHKN